LGAVRSGSEREMTVRKAMDSRNATIHDDGDAPRIRSHSEPIKHLPKHWTRSFSSPSTRISLFYLIRPLESFSEQLFLQNDRHGDNWTTVDGRKYDRYLCECIRVGARVSQ
jgi:hypothetical protein